VSRLGDATSNAVGFAGSVRLSYGLRIHDEHPTERKSAGCARVLGLSPDNGVFVEPRARSEQTSERN
jgi:hypothetical protein